MNPVNRTPEPADPTHLILLSAADDQALSQMRTNLARHLEQQPGLNLCDVAFTLLVGRDHLPHRCFAAARDKSACIAQLTAPTPATQPLPATTPALHLVCPPADGWSLSAWRAVSALAPALPKSAESSPTQRALDGPLWLEAWLGRRGVTADAIIGYGSGVWAAGVLAGVFSADTARRLADGQTTGIRLAEPNRPLYLGYGGVKVAGNTAQDIRFWQQTARETDSQTVTGPLFQEPVIRLLLGETGPHEQLNGTAIKPTTLTACPRHGDDNLVHHLHMLLGRLFVAGLQPNHTWLGAQTGRRVPLPGYPFQGRAFWIDAKPPRQATPATQPQTPTAMLDGIIAKLTEAEAAFLLNLIQAPGTATTAPPSRQTAPTRQRAAATALEQRLVAICRRLLQLDAVDPHENITRLGADSLFMMQLSKEVYEQFQTGISPHHLFEEPTIHSLARKLTRLGVGRDKGGAL